MGQHRAPRGNRRETSASRKAVAPSSTGYSGAGKRRAETTTSGVMVPGLPSAPVVAGVAALAISAAGAVTATATPGLASASGDIKETVPTSGTQSNRAAVARIVENRREVVSRDSRRDAQSLRKTASLQLAAETQATEREVVLKEVASAAEQESEKIQANQWVLPCTGYHLTSRFHEAGPYWSSGYHTGLDFAAPMGTPLYAVANGTITATGWDGSYGNKTVLTLEDGTEIWYAHQSAWSVNVGEQVTVGQVIGAVGETGNAYGAHVHVETFLPDGTAVDPFKMFTEHGVTP